MIEVRRTHYDEAEKWLEKVEDAVARYGWKEVAVRAQHFRGRLQRLRNDYSSAVPTLREAERQGKELGDLKLLAELRWDLAEALSECGELDQAGQYTRRSLKDYTQIQDEVGCALCWQSLGEIYKLQGRHTEAARQLRNAQELYEDAGYRWGEASALNSLGDVTRYLGDAGAALSYYDRAGALFRAIGSGSAIVPEYNSGLVLLEQGREDEARPVFVRCLAEFDRQGRMSAQLDAHLTLAGCAAVAKDWLEWDQHLHKALAFQDRSGGADEDTARIAEMVGTKTLGAGDAERAHQAFSLALTHWRALQRDDEATRVLTLMATN